MISIILTCIIAVMAAYCWKMNRKMAEYRSVCTETLEELEANNVAWEKGLDDQQELYEMQMLTLEERLEEACETAVELFDVFKEQEGVISDYYLLTQRVNNENARLGDIVLDHKLNCLPRLGQE